MRRFTSWMGFMVVLAAAGCSPSSSSAPKPPAGSDPTASGGSAAPGSNEAPKTESEKGKSVLPGDPDIKFDPKVFSITPIAKSDSKTLTPAQLGQKMDASLRGLKDAYAQANVNAEVPALGKLTGRTELKIVSPTKYNIEFFEMEDLGTASRVVADGKRRAELTQGGWKKLPPPTESGKSKPVTEATLKEWPSRFLRDMQTRWLTGGDVWGPLLTAMDTGESGYEVKMEVRTEMVNKKGRNFYRIVAQTQTPNPTTFELRVDGIRFVPITVRVVEKLPNGEENKLMWSANWAYGGSHPAKNFQLPDKL